MWDADLSTWKQHLENYDAAISSITGTDENNLHDLEKFAWEELPASINGRDPPHMTAEEYKRLVRWKLRRGKWRPRLQSFANAITDEQIIGASKKSFLLLREKAGIKALDPLIALRGCGPATASAVLAIFDESIPFMADELLEEAIEGKRTYTKKVYSTLVEKAVEKASLLTKEDDEKTWTPRDVEKAVFASRHFHGSAPKQKKSDAHVKADKGKPDADEEELTFLERVYINHLHQGKIPIAQEKNNTENTTKTQEKKIGEQKKTQKRRNSSENKEESPTKTTKRRARVMKDEKVKDEDVGPAKRPRRSRKKSTETDS